MVVIGSILCFREVIENREWKKLLILISRSFWNKLRIIFIEWVE